MLLNTPYGCLDTSVTTESHSSHLNSVNDSLLSRVILLLIYLLLYFINLFIILTHSVVSFTFHDREMLCTYNLFIYLLYLFY